MPQRLDDFNKKFVYTDTNPENIIPGRKNALFFRRYHDFYFNADGNLDGAWIKLPYRTVVIPPPPLTKLIQYRRPFEVWLKTTDGFYDEFEELLPKTGWELLSYEDLFLGRRTGRKLNWIFPPPTSSNDTFGNNNSRSYDENYFYAKIGSKWYRTPIATYNYVEAEGADRPELTTGLPFVDSPRYLPVPNAPGFPGDAGEQSYDIDYFYIKPSTWKRSSLLVYTGLNKMAIF